MTVVVVFAISRAGAGRHRPSGTGRAALRAYRTVGDVRAAGRGTLGRRLVRRSAFRALG